MTALAPLATSLAAPRVARPRAAGTRATHAVPRAMAQPVAVARPAASGASVGAPRHAAVVAPLRARRVVPRGARRAAQPAVLAAASKPDPSAGAGAKEPGSSASDGRWSSVVRALADVMEPSAVASLLDEELPAHEDIHRGRLANGLRYVVLPNKVPGDRFEAHLEMHVGSVDERADEQGLAHLVEHVTFLGSKKRDAWLGSGTRGNAYTDFHHTVFHVHSPTYNKDSTYMIPNVLDILYDVAFNPQLLDTRVAKEKKAVLAEAQMMNTIEYRVDCQLLQHLHWDNNLGCRFPIGKLDQVESWDAEKVRQFHERWYFPANATLYVVGDFHADVPGVVEMIEQAFGAAEPATHAPGFVGPVPENPESTPAFEGATKAPTMADGDAEDAESSGALRDRHSVRPPVRHA